MKERYTIRDIAIAIYTVNRHAKTASNNKQLYLLKKLALEKLINEGHAKKIGLHFVDNPKFSKQLSTVLVRCDDFLFHTIPEKEDFKVLPHLGQQDQTSRNPQIRMSLNTARNILVEYIKPTNIIENEKTRTVTPKTKRRNSRPVQNSSGFRSSYLDGK